MSGPCFHTHIKTALGEMIAIATENELLLLEFLTSRKLLDKQISRICSAKGTNVGDLQQRTTESHPLFALLQSELDRYFLGELKDFATGFALTGSDFQQDVWRALLNIPYGSTVSYAQQAQSMGRHKAVRAVANANGRNSLTILVPCHRVVGSGGNLGGYGAGIERKKWLLAHEAKFA